MLLAPGVDNHADPDRHHPLPRPSIRAVGLHQRPIMMTLAIFDSAGFPDVHAPIIGHEHHKSTHLVVTTSLLLILRKGKLCYVGLGLNIGRNKSGKKISVPP
jgi:hypothetical protein